MQVSSLHIAVPLVIASAILGIAIPWVDPAHRASWGAHTPQSAPERSVRIPDIAGSLDDIVVVRRQISIPELPPAPEPGPAARLPGELPSTVTDPQATQPPSRMRDRSQPVVVSLPDDLAALLRAHPERARSLLPRLDQRLGSANRRSNTLAPTTRAAPLPVIRPGRDTPGWMETREEGSGIPGMALQAEVVARAKEPPTATWSDPRDDTGGAGAAGARPVTTEIAHIVGEPLVPADPKPAQNAPITASELRSRMVALAKIEPRGLPVFVPPAAGPLPGPRTVRPRPLPVLVPPPLQAAAVALDAPGHPDAVLDTLAHAPPGAGVASPPAAPDRGHDLFAHAQSGAAASTESTPHATAEVPAPPYVFIGQMVEQDGAALAFLERGDRVYSVRAGDLIDDEYRVELIDQNALVLTYLPLSLRQTVRLSSGHSVVPANPRAGR